MIDTEVARLRRLRNVALRTRAVAAAIESEPAPRDSVFSRSAASCWRIARVITGRLRSHPYLNYQRGPSEVRGVYDRVGAALLGAMARYRGRSLQIFAGELRLVARELDDARALTLSSDLSDILGRSQTQIRALIGELDAVVSSVTGSFCDAGPRRETPPRLNARTGAAGDDADGVAETWPYLAI